MKRMTFAYCHIALLLSALLWALPSAGHAADCFLKLTFEETIDGSYRFQSLESVFDNLENEVKRNTLTVLLPTQIQMRNSEDKTIAAFTTGGSLRGVGESFLGSESDELAAEILVERAQKTMYLPAKSGTTSIGVYRKGSYQEFTKVSNSDLQCTRSCFDAGEQLLSGGNCCSTLLPLVQESGDKVCSRCGDGICSEWESQKNCPVDCQVAADSLECTPGVRALVECSSLVAFYNFEGDSNNRVRRNYALIKKGRVAFNGVRAGGRAADLSQPRSYLSGGKFRSTPVSTISAWVRVDRFRGRTGVVSVGTRKGEGITLGIRGDLPFIELTTRKKNAKIDGKKIRRKRPRRDVNGKLKGFRGGLAKIISRRAITNKWTHLALTREREAVTGDYIWRLYIDGEFAASRTTNFEPRLNSLETSLLVGTARRARNIRGFLSGAIDDVSLWQRPLTGSEIALIAQ